MPLTYSTYSTLEKKKVHVKMRYTKRRAVQMLAKGPKRSKLQTNNSNTKSNSRKVKRMRL